MVNYIFYLWIFLFLYSLSFFPSLNMYIAVICLVLYGIVYCLIFFSAYYEVAINLTSQKEMNVCQNALVCALETISKPQRWVGQCFCVNYIIFLTE